MKKTLLAALIGSAVLLSACQDKDAQAKIEQLNQTVAQLTAENTQLKNTPAALFPEKLVIFDKTETVTYPADKENELEESQGEIKFHFSTLKTNINWLDKLLLEWSISGNTTENLEKNFNNTKKEMLEYRLGSSEQTASLNFIGQKERLATFSRYDYTYAGGAHGMFSESYFIVDLLDHKVLTLQDFFSDKNKLENILWETYVNSNATPFINKSDFYVSNDFYFASDGVHFVYPPYAIGPFVEGIMEIKLPWFEVSRLELINKAISEKYTLPVLNWE